MPAVSAPVSATVDVDYGGRQGIPPDGAAV